jgi:hypothetical protein
MAEPTSVPIAVSVLGAVAWPITVLIVLLIFRRPITGITEAVQRLEGPGGVKVFLDPDRVKQVIQAGRRENLSEDAIAKRVIESAEIANSEELRILRALFDEPTGRLLENYVRYYPAALNSLMSNGNLQKVGRRYTLTPKGLDATARYLRSAIDRTATARTVE